MDKQMVYPKAFFVYGCSLVILKLLYLVYCTSIITSFLSNFFSLSSSESGLHEKH